MRKKKFVILGILFCMAVICLLAPRLWGVGCPPPTPTTTPTTAATLEEILSEFNPALRLGFDDFSSPYTFSFSTAEPVEIRTFSFSNVTPADSVVPHLQPSLSGGPSAICDLPDTFKDSKKPPLLSDGIPAKYSDEDGDWYWGIDGHLYPWPPPDELLLKRAKLISTVRFTGALRSLSETWGDDFGSAQNQKRALQRLGVGSREELTSIILEQLRDPDSDLNNPGPIDLSGRRSGMIMLEPQPAQPVTEDDTPILIKDDLMHHEPFIFDPDNRYTDVGYFEEDFLNQQSLNELNILQDSLTTELQQAEAEAARLKTIRDEKYAEYVKEKEYAELGTITISEVDQIIIARCKSAWELASLQYLQAEREAQLLRIRLDQVEGKIKEVRGTASGVDSVVDHLQPFVLGGPTSEERKAKIAWEKALDKAREADNKAREAREAAKKLSEALNNAMDAEPGSDEARKAGEEVSKAAKEAKETGKEADKASKEARKATEEAKKASDAAKKR